MVNPTLEMLKKARVISKRQRAAAALVTQLETAADRFDRLADELRYEDSSELGHIDSILDGVDNL